MVTAILDARGSDRSESASPESPVETLLRIASSARLYRPCEGGLCVEFPSGDCSAMTDLKSPKFQNWLIDGYFDWAGRRPSAWVLRRALDVLEARADARMSTLPSVYLRVGGARGQAGDGQACYIDVGDATGRAIKIEPAGWSLVDRPAVRFRRPEGLLPFPLPSRDGSIDLLRPYVNLSEPDFRLLVIWLTSALRPAGPFPILALCGEQGSGKSTLAKLVRLLVDPQACALLAQPRNSRELVSSAVSGWLLAYDNLSVIPDWLSDSLCRLADGVGFLTRAHASGDGRSVVQVQRPVVLNGINDFVHRGDLADRCVFLHLPPVQPTQRRSEQKYWASFHADYPRILAGVLDAVAGGLRALPSLELAPVPRMADFACWGEAAGRGMGWADGIFSTIYRDNRREATQRRLEDSAVGTATLAMVRGLRRWSGPSDELHDALTKIAGREIAASTKWPKTISTLAKELRRISCWLAHPRRIRQLRAEGQ